MKATSAFATQIFKPRIDWAERYGPDQVAHNVRTLTEYFHRDAFLAASAAIFDDLKAQHAQLVASGVVDRSDEKSIEKTAITIPGHNAVSVRFPDGNNLLFIFAEEIEEERIDGDLKVLTWADPVPKDVLEEYKTAVQAARSYAELLPSIQKLASYGGIEQNAFYHAHGALPVSLSDLKAAIAERGLDGVSGVGTFSRRSFGFLMSHGFFNFEAFAGREKCSIENINRVFSSFVAVEEYKGDRGKEFFEVLKSGKLEDTFSSACALAFEHYLDGGLAKIEGIVAASEELGLSTERVLVYHDLDVLLYAERHNGRDVYVNTDVDGSCCASVLTKHDDKPASLHVYSVERWNAGFTNYWGNSETDPLIPEKEMEYAKYGLTREPLIAEYELFDQIKAGSLPDSGLVMAYDFNAKTLEITPLAEVSSYLNYWQSRVSRDLEEVQNAAKGEFPEYGTEFQEHSRGDRRYRHVSPEDFLARKANPTV